MNFGVFGTFRQEPSSRFGDLFARRSIHSGYTSPEHVEFLVVGCDEVEVNKNGRRSAPKSGCCLYTGVGYACSYGHNSSPECCSAMIHLTLIIGKDVRSMKREASGHALPVSSWSNLGRVKHVLVGATAESRIGDEATLVHKSWRD